MANQKVYKIVIEGVDVAIKDINTLREALNDIGDNKSSKATDELAAAQSRLAKALNENAQEVASVKAAAKEALDIAKLQAQVNDNVEGSYNRLSAQYSLNKIALNKMSEEERRTTDEGKKLVEETNEIYQKMKELQAETGKMSLNVGNYTDSINKAEVTTKSLKEELKSIKDEMANMVLNGEKGSDAYQKLAQRAGELKDAMADANDEISHFASDTRGIDNVINLASTATAAFGVYQGVMATLNIEDEEFEKTMQKMAGIMTTLNSLQQLQNNLTKDGTVTAKAYHAVMKLIGIDKSSQVKSTKALTTATAANTVATKSATVATTGLGVALKAIGIGLIISAVALLIEYWDELVGWFEKTFPELGSLSSAFNKLKNVCVGVGNAVVEYMIMPFKTLGGVIRDLINGDFENLFKHIEERAKKGFDIVGNFKTGYDSGELSDAVKKNLKDLDETFEFENAVYGKSHKRTQEYLRRRMKLFKSDSEEYRRMYIELLTDMREEEDENNKKRESEAKEAEEKRKKIAEEGLRKRKELAKKEAEAYKELLKDIDTATKESMENLDNAFSTSIEKTSKRFTDIIKRPPEEVIKVYKAAGNAIVSQIDKNTIDILSASSKRYLKLLSDAGYNVEKYKNILKDAGADVNKDITKLQSEALLGLEFLYKDISEKYKKITESFKLGKIVKKQMEDQIRELYISVDKDFEKIVNHYKEKVDEIYKNFSGLNLKINEDVIDSLGLVEEALGNKEWTGITKTIFESWFAELDAIIGQHNFNIAKANEENEEKQTEALKRSKKEQLDIEKNSLDKMLNETKKSVENTAESLTPITSFLGNKMNEIFKPSEFKANLDEYRNAWMSTFDNMAQYLDDENKKTYSRLRNIIKEVVDELGIESEEFNDAMKSMQLFLNGTILNFSQKWDEYTDNVAVLYGKDSEEYIRAIEDKKNATKQFYDYVTTASRNANVETPLTKSTSGSTQDSSKVQKKNPIQKAMESWEEAPYETIADIYDEINDLVLYPAEDAFNAYLDFVIQEAEEALEEVQKLHDEAIDRVDESTDRISELQDKIKNGNKDEVESMKQALADEQLLLAQREANEQRLAREEEQKERELRHREKQQQRLDLGRSLIEASVNTAMGVTKALGDYGWPLGPIFAGFIAAMGAVQTAFIAKQIAKLQDGGSIELGNGGKVRGKSHSQGGVPVGDTGIEVEGGEVVINKKSSKKFLPLLDAINADGNGGKHTVMKGNTTTVNDYITNTKFETGGVINNYSTSNAYSTVFNRTLSNGGLIKSYTINKIYKTEKMDVGGRFSFEKADSILRENDNASNLLKAINDIDFSPTVSVVDINRGQKNLTKVQMLAGKR